MARRKQVTRKDVAERAGVSVATVSYVVNGGPRPVSPETKARVEQAILELGYSPNELARSLAARRTYAIGLAMRTHRDMWAAQIIQPIEELAHASGFEVFVGTHHAEADRERSVLRALNRRRVEGMIILNSVLGGEIGTLQDSLGIPTVLISPLVPSSHRYSVQTDDVGGARAAVELLIRLGHRRIAHIGAPEWTAPGRDRLLGYGAALDGQGISWDPGLVFEGDADMTGGLEGALALLQAAEPPSALFCFNDLTAVGALRGAQLSGLRVPQDLSVVGYDDLSLVGYLNPPLTTIRQDTEALGEHAARMLLDLIAGRETRAPVVLDTELVERLSCAVREQ